MKLLGFVLAIVVLLGVVLFLAWIYKRMTRTPIVDRLVARPSFLDQKVDCDRVQVPCTSNDDCSASCTFGDSCIQGVCSSAYQVRTSCDATKGQIAVYQLNAANVYESTCFSVDPGVALDDGRNVYCQGGRTGPIDYTKKYPNACSCDVYDVILPVWGNLTRRQTYGCVDSIIYKKTYKTRSIIDHY